MQRDETKNLVSRASFLKTIGVLAAFVLLTHCASTKPAVKPEDERELLKRRVSEYWQYQIEGKVDMTYQMEAPEFRERVPLIQYLNRYRYMRYVGADVLEVSVEGKRGKASVKTVRTMNLVHLRQKKFTETKEERWVEIEKKWYHIPQEFEM